MTLVAKIKCHHPHPVKAGSWNYGKAHTDPWVRYTVYDTCVEVPRSEICTKVFSRVRSKHTQILAWFHPGDFLADLHRYVGITRVLRIGKSEVNTPPAELADEEAWLF
jgi:hypothetical protein